ncbi:NAD-dependent epimerase/dehydratase family protein [Aliarcobacter cryaerophilus]|uniref:NAD-dependent epimerase/dehydratase family protein n=1 Tax=Aliarcobacter cryaerophilus TaxID=28198 RepID=UPI0021B501E3|nr:NAD-dependent epimerase/dehydratase family protein [Aliarcobacter cryaerophilus]MCT7520062.1 NAD-dependent epimerase/dehydratase family protein [Aliarcobacter cryaerophilus]
MKKILLLTGTTGFIGQNLLKFIELNYKNHYEIVLLSSAINENYKTVLHKNYTFNKQDFEKNGILKVDIVLHIGAFTPKSGIEANDINKSNANIFNTKYLLDNLPNFPEKFIFLSTLDVYGKVEEVISEKILPNPITLYGWSKLYCEKMIENWAKGNNVIIQILRVGHIYGKGEESYKKVIPITIQRLKEGNAPQIFGTGFEKRSFLHVDDVCSMILKSIKLVKYEGVINLCSAHSFTIKEIIDMLIEISAENLEINYINTENVGIDFEFDTLKMNKLLGYEKINMKDGLKDEYN